MILMLLELAAHASEEAGHTSFTLTDFWAAAGIQARGVIITLAVMLLGCIFVFFERSLAFNRSRKQSAQLAAEIVKPMETGDLAKALKVANDERFKSAYLATLLKAGLKELSERQDADGVANARRAVEKAHSEETAKMKNWMTVLATTGSTGPFVGLFGTTFGVINAFSGMATAGSGLASISAGISEALYTTAIGIGVAVVGVWMFNWFNRKTEIVSTELETSEQDFIAWAEKLIQDQVTAGK